MGGHGSEYVRRTPIASYEEVLNEGVLCACCISVLPPGKRGYHQCVWSSNIGKCFKLINSLQAELSQIDEIEDRAFKLCSECYGILDKFVNFKKKTDETFKYLGESTLENIRHGVRYYDLDLRSDGKPWKDCVCVACLCCNRQLSTVSSLRGHQAKGLCRDGCSKCSKESKAEHAASGKASNSESLFIGDSMKNSNKELNPSNQVTKENSKENVPINVGKNVKKNNSKPSNKVVEDDINGNINQNNKSSASNRTKGNDKNDNKADDNNKKNKLEAKKSTLADKNMNTDGTLPRSGVNEQNHEFNQLNGNNKYNRKDKISPEVSFSNPNSDCNKTHSSQKNDSKEENLSDDSNKSQNHFNEAEKKRRIKLQHIEERNKQIKVKRKSIIPLNYPNPWLPAIEMPWYQDIIQSDLKMINKTTIKASENNSTCNENCETRESINAVEPSLKVCNKLSSNILEEIKNPLNTNMCLDSKKSKNTDTETENSIIERVISNESTLMQSPSDANMICDQNTEPYIKKTIFNQNAMVYIPERTKNIVDFKMMKKYTGESKYNARNQNENNPKNGNCNETINNDGDDTKITDSQLERNMENIVGHSPMPVDAVLRPEFSDDSILRLLDSPNVDNARQSDDQYGQARNNDTEPGSASKRRLSSQSSESSKKKRLRNTITGTGLIQELDSSEETYNGELRLESEDSIASFIQMFQGPITKEKSTAQNFILDDPEKKLEPVRVESVVTEKTEIIDKYILEEETMNDDLIILDDDDDPESVLTDKTEVIDKNMKEEKTMNDDLIILDSDDDHSCDTIVYDMSDVERSQILSNSNPGGIDGSNQQDKNVFIKTEADHDFDNLEEIDGHIFMTLKRTSNENNIWTSNLGKRTKRSKSCSQPTTRTVVRGLSLETEESSSYLVSQEQPSHPSMLSNERTHLPLQPELLFSDILRPPMKRQHRQLSLQPSQSPQQHLQSCSKPLSQKSQLFQIPSEGSEASKQNQQTLRRHLQNWSSQDKIKSTQNSEKCCRSHCLHPPSHHQQLLAQVTDRQTSAIPSRHPRLKSQHSHSQQQPSSLQRVPQNLSQDPQLLSRHQHPPSQPQQLLSQHSRLTSSHPPQRSRHRHLESKTHLSQMEGLATDRLQRRPSVPKSSRSRPPLKRTSVDKFASAKPYRNRSPGHIVSSSTARIPSVHSQTTVSETQTSGGRYGALNDSENQPNGHMNSTYLHNNSNIQSPYVGPRVNHIQSSEGNTSRQSNDFDWRVEYLQNLTRMQ